MRKAALITGGTGGLGSALARALHKRGYRLAINYLRDEAAALRLARTLDGIALQADVSDYPRMEEMARRVKEELGRLDALVNCAGMARDALLLKQTPGGWDEVLGTNLTGAFNCIKAFAPFMIESGGGHIVNISSYSGVKGKAGQAAYSASKAALLGLTYSAAAELAGYDIRVNAVLPGYMPTRMGRAAEAAMLGAKDASLLGVLSDPAEAAECIAGLLETRNITGQVFSVESRII